MANTASLDVALAGVVVQVEVSLLCIVDVLSYELVNIVRGLR